MAAELEKYQQWLDPKTLEYIGTVISLAEKVLGFVNSLEHDFKVYR